MKKMILLFASAMVLTVLPSCSKKEEPGPQPTILSFDQGVQKITTILAHEGITLKKDGNDYITEHADVVGVSYPKKHQNKNVDTFVHESYSYEDNTFQKIAVRNAVETYYEIYDIDESICYYQDHYESSNWISGEEPSTSNYQTDCWQEIEGENIYEYDQYRDFIPPVAEERTHYIESTKDWNVYPSHLKLEGILGELEYFAKDSLNGRYVTTSKSIYYTLIDGECLETFTFVDQIDGTFTMNYTVTYKDALFQQNAFPDHAFMHNGNYSYTYHIKDYLVTGVCVSYDHYKIAKSYPGLAISYMEHMVGTMTYEFSDTLDGYVARNKTGEWDTPHDPEE